MQTSLQETDSSPASPFGRVAEIAAKVKARMNLAKQMFVRGRCAVLLALVSCIGAQAGTLRGKVLYAGHALPAVQITAHRADNTVSAISDSSGLFQFAD